MTKKFVYSVFREQHAYPRIIDESIEGDMLIIPKSSRGRAVSYGKLLDTSAPFSNIDQLTEDRYKYYTKGNVLSYGIQHGDAWLSSEESNFVWSVFAHQVRHPGIHFIIEWKKTIKRTMQPYNEDYSPLYASYDEALEEVVKHMRQAKIKNNSSEVEYEKDSKNHHYRLLLSGIQHDYRILSLEISESVYEQATDVFDDRYYVNAPWIHFKQSSH